jgi:hypothetical protein
MQKLLDFEHPIINEKGADRDVSAARPERQNNTVNKVVCLVIFKHRAPDRFPSRAQSYELLHLTPQVQSTARGRTASRGALPLAS